MLNDGGSTKKTRLSVRSFVVHKCMHFAQILLQALIIASFSRMFMMPPYLVSLNNRNYITHANVAQCQSKGYQTFAKIAMYCDCRPERKTC